jgi:fumarylacetoacetase
MSNNSAKSWIEVPAKSDFPLQNIPFGIIKTDKHSPRVASIIGNTVIDIAALNHLGYFKGLTIPQNVLENKSLNDFIALGKAVTTKVRERLIDLFSENNSELKNNPEHKNAVLIDVAKVENLMPVEVGDYTDFYSSMEHATNVGKMFRDPANALLPNWKHLPVGYHGRASSIFVSGTSFHRPKGQSKAPDAELPTFGPSKLLDFELEMAFIIGKENKLGESISTAQAEEYIFGLVLFNDWSARDIQAWEYVPLGPFLAKNFFSSVSPWVVTLEALDPFRVQGPVQEPKVLPYLEYSGAKNYDIQLNVFIQPENGEENIVCHSNFKYMYWNMCQQLAHHTINGCNVRIGDMMASGTISGPTEDSFGSMLEITWRGAKPVKLKDGSERKFINDNDTVTIRGYAEKDGLRIGFGEVKNKALPAILNV